jgi:hypothetical protein
VPRRLHLSLTSASADVPPEYSSIHHRRFERMEDYLGLNDSYWDDLWWTISSTTPSLPDVHPSSILEDLELFNESKCDLFTSKFPVDSHFLTQAAVEDGSEEMGASTSYFDAGLTIPERQPSTASPPPINVALPELRYDGRRSTTEGSESALSSYANTLCSDSPCSSSRLTFSLACGVSEPPLYTHTYDSDKDFNRISSTVHDDLGFGRFSLRSSSECRPARRRGFHLDEEDRTRAAKVRRVGACEKCRQGKRRVILPLTCFIEHVAYRSAVSARIGIERTRRVDDFKSSLPRKESRWYVLFAEILSYRMLTARETQSALFVTRRSPSRIATVIF